MGVIKIKKGLELPINGSPEPVIDDSKNVKRVALLGNDFVGLKPTLEVAVGDNVKLGQLLFTDKKMPGVKFTSPAPGKIIAINRGEKRKFLSIVIEIEGNEEVIFDSFSESQIPTITNDQVKTQLIESGVWTSFRERPFSKVADPETIPNSIFVTAIDSNPLAPSIEKILEGNESDFKNGLRIISKLTEGKVFLCKEHGENIPDIQLHNLTVQEFSGVHPKGLVGTHIHFVDPVNR